MEKNLGHATAYGYAKSKGYTGTEEEFAELMADYASVGQSAAQSAEQAAASATSASGSAATATQAAQTATDKASEASQSASTASTKAQEASQSASESSQSASTAVQAKTDAETAKQASETAQRLAESARDGAAQSASEAAESARTLTIDATLTQAGQAADAKATGDAITVLKSDINYMAVAPYDVTSGYYDSNNGNVQNPSAYWQEKHTSYFDVENVNAIVWLFSCDTQVTQNAVTITKWDNEGEFIGRENISEKASLKTVGGTILTADFADDVKYIAFSFSTRGYEVNFDVKLYYSVHEIDKLTQHINNQINGLLGKSVSYSGEMQPYGICNINLLTTVSASNIDTSNPGGMDIYGNTLVMLMDRGGILLWNLSTNTIIGEYSLASASDTNHANQAHFSKVMGTTYPLLYISECYGNQRCFVEDIGISSSSLIQTISFDNANGDYNGAYDWILDNYSDHIMTYGNTADGSIKIKVFNIPDINNTSVILTESDVIDEWVIDEINEMFTWQGATIVYNTLYLAGFVSATGNYIWAIDKNSHSLKGRADISNVVSYAHEIEDLAIYNNHLMASTHSRRIYSLSFS